MIAAIFLIIFFICIIGLIIYFGGRETAKVSENKTSEPLKKEQEIRKAYKEVNRKFIVDKIYYEDLYNGDYMHTHVVYFYKILKREVVNHTDMKQTMKRIVIHLTADNQVITITEPSIIKRGILSSWCGGYDFFKDLPCKYGFVTSHRATILTSTDKYINLLPKEFLE